MKSEENNQELDSDFFVFLLLLFFYGTNPSEKVDKKILLEEINNSNLSKSDKEKTIKLISDFEEGFKNGLQ